LTRVHYTPVEPGNHRIEVKFGGNHCRHSPFDVSVIPAFFANEVHAYGRGLQSTGLRIKEKCSFCVTTTNAGEATLGVYLTGVKGNPEPIEVVKRPSDPKTFDCYYTPNRTGAYKIQITWGGQNIPKSPYTINVGPEAGPQKVRAYGPGLRTGKVGYSADFVVETTGTEIGQLGFQIEGPSQTQIQCDDCGDGSCNVSYFPKEAGEYAVHILCDGDDIVGSPFMADILPEDLHLAAERVKCYGPGVESGTPICGQVTQFVIESNGADKSSKKLKVPFVEIVAADGTQVKCNVKQVSSGVWDCEYTPHKAVKHTLCVDFDGVSIPNSPFRVQVQEASHPENVQVSGPGLQPTGLRAKELTYFIVDCARAGTGDISIGIKCAPGVLSDDEVDIDFDIIKNDNDTFTVKYTPPAPGPYTIMVLFADSQIPQSPITVQVKKGHDEGKVRCDGPALKPNSNQVGQKTHFTIFTRGAGIADAAVTFRDSDGKIVNFDDFSITKNVDHSYTVAYTPEFKGALSIDVTYGDDRVPGAPFAVNVIPLLVLDNVIVENMEDQVFTRNAQKFNVITENAGGKGQLECKILSPINKIVYARIATITQGVYHQVEYTPIEEGSYRIDVLYDGQLVPGSPWLVEAAAPPDPTKVRVYGPGLHSGVVKDPAPFTIDTRGAGAGGLGLTVEGPCEAKIECVDNGDCTCSVSFLPTEPGAYIINVLFADKHVPGSPFTSNIRAAYNSAQVKVADFNTSRIRVAEEQSIRVDCSTAGIAQLSAEIRQANGTVVRAAVSPIENQPGVYNLSFVPTCQGQASFNINYGEELVPGFPRNINILQAIDTSKIRCYGDGIDGKDIFVDVVSNFTIDAKCVNSHGGAQVNARAVGPAGMAIPVDILDNHDGTYVCSYVPYEAGQYSIVVDYESKPVPESPFIVQVTEGCVPSKVKAFGPGLQAGTTEQPARFTVDTRGAGTGGLGLAVEGPSDARITCKDNKDGTCSVEYYPTAAGDYEVHITYGGEPVNGSPFIVPVRDEVDHSKVVLAGPGIKAGVRANIPTHFTIDASRAGVAMLEVSLLNTKTRKPIQVQVDETSQQIFSATYTAEEPGNYEVNVKYCNKQIPCCPIKFPIALQYDSSKVKYLGDQVNANNLASFPIQFTIDASEAGEGVLTVCISDPEGKPKKSTVSDNGDGTYTVTFIPDMVGKYAVSIKYGGDEIPKSPFKINTISTGDASKSFVSGPLVETQVMRVGEETCIKVDAKRAGKGVVRTVIQTPNDGVVDVPARDNKDGTWDIFYTPKENGKHCVHVRFGGNYCQNMPLNCEAFGRHGNLRPDQVRPWHLNLTHCPENVKATVKTPSNKVVNAGVSVERDGSTMINFDATERGLHFLEMTVNGQPISGSPVEFYADLVAPGYVTAYGQGLSWGYVGEPARFTIVTKEAGSGGLSLSVEGPSKAEIQCKDNKDGTCSVQYFPTAPGQYKITIKFDDQHIIGSPFTASVVPPEPAIVTYGISAEIPLRIADNDLTSLTVSVRAPSGNEFPAAVRRLSDGRVGIVFTPKEIGEHVVSVRRKGRHVANSPFVVRVAPSEIGDSSKVSVYGQGIEEIKALELAEFFVDTRNAGYGGLGVSIEGPSRVDINFEDLQDGVCRVTYCPQEPGTYTVNVKFADRHVPGSPFTVKCTGEGKLKESIVRQRKAAQVATVGAPCDLNLKIPNVKGDINELRAEVTSPSGKTEVADVLESGRASYSIRFVPKELGTHLVAVKYHNQHVPGSPFKFTVGPLGKGGSKNVTASGPGLESGIAKQINEFSIWTREAGAGGLSIAVEGPSKADIQFEDRKDGSCGVQYSVVESGPYEVSIKFNDEQIPGSPFPVFIEEPVDGSGMKRSDASKVKAQGDGLHAALVNQQNEFLVDCTKAGSNILLVGIHGPKSPCEEVYVKHLGNKNYNVTYTVQEKGNYVLIVKWGDEHIPGSPFHVTVP